MIAFLIRIPCDSAISLFGFKLRFLKKYIHRYIFKKYTDKQKIVSITILLWIGCCAGIEHVAILDIFYIPSYICKFYKLTFFDKIYNTRIKYIEQPRKVS